MKKRKRRSHVNAQEFERLSQCRLMPTDAMRALDEGSRRLFDSQAAPSLSLETRELMRAQALSIMALLVKENGEDMTVALDGEEHSLTAEEIQAVSDGILASACFDIGSRLQSTLKTPPVPSKKGGGAMRKKRLAKKKRKRTS
jgi:hypothetical protein